MNARVSVVRITMLFAMSPINNYAYCLFLPTLLGRFPLAIGVIKTSFLKYCFLKPQIHKVNCNQPYTDIMAKFICEIVTLLLKYTQNILQPYIEMIIWIYCVFLFWAFHDKNFSLIKNFPWFVFSLQLKIKAIRSQCQQNCLFPFIKIKQIFALRSCNFPQEWAEKELRSDFFIFVVLSRSQLIANKKDIIYVLV